MQEGLRKEYVNFVKIAVEIIGKETRKLKTDVYNEVKDRGDLYDILMPNCCFIDINRKYCNLMKKKYPEAEVLVGDIRKLPFGNNSFDMIIDLSTMDHILEYKIALSEYMRILKSSGLLALVVWAHCGPTVIRRNSQYIFDIEEFSGFVFNNFNVIADGRFVKGCGELIWYLARNK